jgi:decaprenyl-phosphate phosphoribosyltransferase
VASSLRAIVKTLRPHQWVKNLFVAAPLVFAKHLTEGEYVVRSALAVGAFCALSGAVYAFNDVRDVEADRAHPTKRHRPIAAGQLGERAALVLAAVLALIGLGTAAALAPMAGVWAGVYLAQNLAYSLKLKQVAFVDVLLIAAGFILRVVAGGAAIRVEPSPWLLACTGLLAGFLGMGKRAHELARAQASGRDVASTRAALAGYRPMAVQIAMVTLALATITAYVLYTFDEHTVTFFGTRNLVWSAPFCALGIARFAMLALRRGDEDSPTDAMLRDWPFLLILSAWGAMILAIVY